MKIADTSMEIYKWVPLDRKRHLRGPLSTAASGTTTPVHGGKEARLTSGSLTVDSSNVTSKAPSTGYDRTANDRQIAKMLNREYVSYSKRNQEKSNQIKIFGSIFEYLISFYSLNRNVTPMNEDSNLSVASDSQDGTHPVVINTLNGASNINSSNVEDSSASNTATTNGTSKPHQGT